MSELIKDFIVGCVVESDYTSLACLGVQDGSVLDDIYLPLSRELRWVEPLLGRDGLDYAYTDAHRKTLIELTRVFGTVQVLKGVTNFALPNDQKLAEHYLNCGEFNKSCATELKNLAISAAIYGQTEVVHTIVDWMIGHLDKMDLAEDIYKIYEASNDLWIFRQLYETGLLVTVLNAARIGKIDVLPALLDDVAALSDLEKLRVLTAIFRKSSKRI